MKNWTKNMIELRYSSNVTVRFTEDCSGCYVWAPYNAKFIEELKQTFNSKEAMGKSYGLDPGAEWEPVLKCWIVHVGWIGCEDWYNTLIELLNKHYPAAEHP
jgi:hypothetical protein